jgi:uncharacterized protein DUF2147
VKRAVAVLALLTFCGVIYSEGALYDNWKIVDSRKGFTKTIVTVYMHNGIVYGRNIVNFDEDTGDLIDTIYEPSLRVPDIAGNPFLTETNLIWGLEQHGKKWKHGKILDPRNGHVYSCELRVEGDTLIIRGKWGPFFRDQPMYRATDSDFPEGFNPPDTLGWVPNIPASR